MMSFSQFVQRRDLGWLTFSVEHYTVHVLFSEGEWALLNEGKHRALPLGGQYSAQLHKAHSPVGQDHLHVYAKNKQIFSINKDGSAHDGSHRVRIPNRVADEISRVLPGFTLPPGNLIESAPRDVLAMVQKDLLLG